LKIGTQIKFGDGKKLQAQSIGQIITPLGVLSDALFVPHLCANLISVSQLLEIGAFVTFLPNKSEIQLNGMIYPVTCKRNIFHIEEICHLTTTADNEIDLWHQKLGHLSYPTIISFLKRFGIHLKQPDQHHICKICMEGKLNEKRFQHRKNYLIQVLGRIHSDTSGRMVKSLDGYLYWITFIDETSRFVKVKYLKNKSEAEKIITETLKEFQNLKKYGIAIFRSDGGGEYVNTSVENFLKKEGIQHEIISRYTPQMNGIAERLNRTLLEQVRCLLIACGLSWEFWNYAMD
jgi:hypothetical protein